MTDVANGEGGNKNPTRSWRVKRQSRHKKSAWEIFRSLCLC